MKKTQLDAFQFDLTSDFQKAGFQNSVQVVRQDNLNRQTQENQGTSVKILLKGICYFFLFSNVDDYILTVRPSGIRMDTFDGTKSITVSIHDLNDPILSAYGIPARFQLSVLFFQSAQLQWVHAYRRDTGELTVYDPNFKRYPTSPGQKNVLQAPQVVLYQPQYYVKGLRELGYTAESMVYNGRIHAHLMDLPADFDMDWKYPNTCVYEGVTRRVEFFLWAVERYDIFHYHSNACLLSDFYYIKGQTDLHFLKRMGKKLVYSTWGWCDYCLWNSKRPSTYSECDVCVRCRPLLCQNPDHNNRILQTLRYADLILGNGTCCAADSRMKWIDNPIDCNSWYPMSPDEIPQLYRLPSSHKLRIYHSFANAASRDDVKGSSIIRTTVERLQREGYEVEFIYFDSVPHCELKYYMVQADLVIDQLYAGWHGSTGVEALALGKPLITYIDPAIWEIMPHKDDCPIIHATTKTLYDVLKKLICHPDKLTEIGEKSRYYALKYHHYSVVSQELDRLYSQL